MLDVLGRRKVVVLTLTALLLSSCVLGGGEEFLGSWSAGASCDDIPSVEAAVQSVMDSKVWLVGRFNGVTCEDSLDRIAAVIVARNGTALEAGLDERFSLIPICDGQATVAVYTGDELDNSGMIPELAAALDEADDFC